jgi:hypothetical protein
MLQKEVHHKRPHAESINQDFEDDAHVNSYQRYQNTQRGKKKHRCSTSQEFPTHQPKPDLDAVFERHALTNYSSVNEMKRKALVAAPD